MSGVYISMMGSFAITTLGEGGRRHELRSKKGLLLIQYLILNTMKPVPTQTLIEALSLNRTSGNPLNALKTLISRTRILLNEIAPGLGAGIASRKGAYYWRNADGVSVDVYELERLFENLSRSKAVSKGDVDMCERVMELYVGDLSYPAIKPDWIETKAVELREKYIQVVCAYIDYLKLNADSVTCARICRQALEIDEHDDRLHKLLMEALDGDDQTAGGVYDQYYGGIQNTRRMLDDTVDRLTNELCAHEKSSGAIVCELDVFKEIGDIQLRIVERMKSTMFIALITISPSQNGGFETDRLPDVSRCLLETLRDSLRKGDAITQFTPSTFAVTLPMVDYATSRTVLERIKENFYQRNAKFKDAVLSYRTQPYA